MISLLTSKDLNRDNYHLILIKVYRLTKIINYKLIRNIINIVELEKVFIYIVRNQSFLKFILSNKNALFISKFW